jgi:nitrate reductase delta subunit
VEADHVELFDRGRGTALHLFEHVHGDSRDRGPAMVDLCQTYEAAGLFLAPGELPDHLTVVLQYASTQPPTQAKAFLGEIAHILQVIFSALLRREAAMPACWLRCSGPGRREGAGRGRARRA